VKNEGEKSKKEPSLPRGIELIAFTIGLILERACSSHKKALIRGVGLLLPPTRSWDIKGGNYWFQTD